MPIAYLSLGSNLGEKETMLETAIDQLTKRAGEIIARSDIYETEPWGVAGQPVYLNQVISMNTRLTPHGLLNMVRIIERQMGRIRNRKSFQPRPIDIDILFYEQLVLQSRRLTIPHPLMHRRAFVLVPLMEIAPEMMHPLLERSIKDLYAENQDPLAVSRYHTELRQE